jgi:putative ABC transport system substrate-binding protein
MLARAVSRCCGVRGARRRFLLGAIVLFGARQASPAEQQAAKVYRIGFLGAAYAAGYVREVDWIRAGLRDRGYAEGRNLVIEYRWAEGNGARLRQIAAEFVALRVDAIVTHALAGTIAAAAETATIPIVMADGGDPVAAGLAANLARPGRNVTGSFSFTLDEIGKRLQLLKEVTPRLGRLAFLAGPSDATIAEKRNALQAAAEMLRVEVQAFPISQPSDLPGAFEAMAKARVEAVLLNNEPFLNSHAGTIAALAAVKRLPSVGFASYADAGGLIAYGANRPALYGRVGYFLDQIFKGAKPGDLPFERAAKFDVIVNQKTATALGIEFPRALLLRAERVIE